ncbi:MAG: M28 family peptidase [Saprospiraceae bacterium]|nr:M28 family peptidase [Saprospiraceae bacterium]
MKRTLHYIYLLLAIGMLHACQEDNNADTETTQVRSQVNVPRFDRDSAFAFLAKQVAFGPRVPNTEEHRQCGDWLAGQFRSFGADVIQQEFKAEAYTGEVLNGRNIIAQYNRQNRKRILLAAHWDSRHIADSPVNEGVRDVAVLGADDGASGVAVLLEVARQLQNNPVDIGVDIVLFDCEDYGESGADNTESWGLGAQHWSRNLHRTNYEPSYGILLDMVGAKGARFPKEQYSVIFAPEVVEKVWKLANNMGYGNYFVSANGGAVTDDHYFVNTIAKIPMINIINRPVESETGFGPHWHTPEDDLDVIDARTLRAVGQVVLAVIYREAGGTI